MWRRLQRLHCLKCVIFYLLLNTGIYVSSPTEGMDARLPFLCAHVVVCTYGPRDGPVPHPGGTTKYVYVQLVSDSATQAAGHRLLTTEARCCIPEHSMGDLGRRTCAGMLQNVLRLLGRFSVIIITPVFHVNIRRPSTLHCVGANSLAQ